MTIAVNLPKFMVVFHLCFLLLGMLTLLLMIANVILFVSAAYWIIAVTFFANAFFVTLWYRTMREEKTKIQMTMPKIGQVYSMVSFVVPTYNEERNIMRCINGLFKCAVKYRGPSEIIIVDNGSTDNTFEVAWATINSKQRELADIRVKVVRHMSHLGQVEAARAGANKAMGEYVALVDAYGICDPATLIEMVDYLYATQGVVVSRRIPPSSGDTTGRLSVIRLYRADSLRQLLNEKQVSAETLEFS